MLNSNIFSSAQPNLSAIHLERNTDPFMLSVTDSVGQREDDLFLHVQRAGVSGQNVQQLVHNGVAVLEQRQEADAG